MLQSSEYREPQIQLLGIVLLGKFQTSFGVIHPPDKIMGIVTFVDGSE